MSDVRTDFLLNVWQVFCLGILLLFFIWGVLHLPDGKQNVSGSPSENNEDFEVTNVGPRLGFDGRVRVLPSLTPGISF